MSSKTAPTITKPILEPLGDRIIATPLEAETKTKSGFLLPEKTAERAAPELADVIAVGEGVEHIEVGDRIVYEKYGPSKVNRDGIELLILKEEDVLARERVA